MKRTLLILTLFLSLAAHARAQGISVSTNIADYACLGTVNASAEYRLSGHWALEGGFRYNNWNFRCDCDEKAFQDRRRTFHAGAVYWLRDTCEGVWLTARLQVEQYNRGGLFGNPRTEEGDAFGMALGMGLSHWLNHRLRFDAGALFWAGSTSYSLYAAPRCGRCLVQKGRKGFIRYDCAVIALSYTLWEPRNKEK
ncbi:MAG: DUF3575 domain-containing protein [Bacteroidales bacterium]|nr:DUF3575 domain-containing protein [Bacteroidales bacterium]